MIKTVKIGDKEYILNASAFTIFKYKNIFKKDLLKEMNSLEKRNENEETGDVILSVLEFTYAMSDINKEKSFEEFLSEIEGVLDNNNWIKEVSEHLMLIFRRGNIQGN